MKRVMVMVLGLVLASGLFGAAGIAAPFQTTPPAAVADTSAPEPAAYSCRRDCHYSRAYGTWIHGVGPYCRIVQCVPPRLFAPPAPRYYAPRVCTKDWHCVKTGPLGLGRRCYWREICH